MSDVRELTGNDYRMIASATSEASSVFRKHAGWAYQQGEDSAATILRQRSRDMDDNAKALLTLARDAATTPAAKP